MENSKDCVYFMGIFHLKLFYGYWRMYFLLYFEIGILSFSFISLRKHFLCSSSNIYLCIHTYEFKITILLMLLEMTVL